MISKRILSIFTILSLSATVDATTIIGIAGGTGSGKTTLARKIKERFPHDVTLISQDNYYKPAQKELTAEEHSKCNFDIPDALDFALLKTHLSMLKQGLAIPQLSYNFATLKTVESGTIEPNKVIIVEGILLFAAEEVRNEFDLKIFVETDDDIRFARRIEHYQKAYGLTRDFIEKLYFATAKPGHDAYVAPSKKLADIVIPCHKDTSVAEAVIATFITSCIKGPNEMKKTILTPEEQQTVSYYNQHGKTWADQHSPTDKISFWTEEVETLAQLHPTGKILEIGSGAGVEAQLLRQKNYEYVGTDISPTLLTAAQQRNPGATFIEASLYDLPFQANEFDTFWAAAVFLHIPKTRIDEALTSLTSVLKKGACGFISLKAGEDESVDLETNRFFSYFTHDEFAAILKKHNFVIEKSYERTQAKRIKEHTWLCFFVTYEPK